MEPIYNLVNGILIIDNAFDEDYADKLLAEYHKLQEQNKVYVREHEGETMGRRKDTSCNLKDYTDTLSPIDGKHLDLIKTFNRAFWDKHYPVYTKQFDILYTAHQQFIADYKLQRTRPKEGYHVWHTERCSVRTSRRVGVYTYYLNDVEEGGETEFLNLSLRLPSVKNRLCIFPADYLHTHRGNPPLVDDKYIMTGWIEFA